MRYFSIIVILVPILETTFGNRVVQLEEPVAGLTVKENYQKHLE